MSPVLKRLCPSCRKRLITTGRRCALCEQAHNLARGTTTSRGLGFDYQCNRACLLATDTTCWICGQPGADTADHVRPRSRGGTSDITNLKPAHKRCNSGRRP